MIFDSNLIILSIRPQYPGLRRFIATQLPMVSAATVIEVLGYHKLNPQDRADFEQLFQTLRVIQISNDVVLRTIKIRQAKNIGLGDAIIAATALDAACDLHTHDPKDFANIPGLTVIDPIASGDMP